MDFIRAHGNLARPGMRPGVVGLVAGSLAGIPAALLANAAGLTAWLERALGLAAPGLAIGAILASTALMGALYGAIFRRAANDPRGGWLFGLAFGFVMWLIGPAAWLAWLTRSLPPPGAPALALIGSHLLYGLALGGLFPVLHRQLRRPLLHLPANRTPSR